MDTKHKVVLIVFVAFFAVAVLVFLLGGKSKVERFEEEDFAEDTDDEDNEKESPKKTKKKVLDTPTKTKTTKTTKEEDAEDDVTSEEQPINYMKEAMNYLNTMNLPFQLKKEVFTELFSEEGMSKLEQLTTLPDVKKFVTSIVDMTDTSKISKSSPQKESFLEPPLQSGLEDIKKQIGSLTQSLTTMSSAIDQFQKSSPKTTNSPFNRELTLPSTPPTINKKPVSENVIEGFENLRSSYALF